MVEKATPDAPPAPKAPEYLVALEGAPDIRAGQIVANTQANAKVLEGKCRPASEIDLGVAGMLRKD
jgi:hypothetical protein